MAALKELEADNLRYLVESANYFQPRGPVVTLIKCTDDYTQAFQRWSSYLTDFCKGLLIFDVDKPRCPKCKKTIASMQVGKSMTVVVFARCDIAYCMHCCFEQSRSVMSAEKSSVAAVRAHLEACPSSMFLDSDLFDREVTCSFILVSLS